mgnify:FL=1
MMLVGPPFLCGIVYFYWMRTQCYSWRAKLCDRDQPTYPPTTIEDMSYLRRPRRRGITEADDADGVAASSKTPPASATAITTSSHTATESLFEQSMTVMPTEDNPGFKVKEGVLVDVERAMLINELRDIVATYGRPYTREKRHTLCFELESAGLPSDFVDDIRFVSDLYEDPRRPKAPWGAGDSLKLHLVPPVLRELSSRVQDQFPLIGKLRHVQIEFSPGGRWYCKPKLPHGHAGHDYVIIPLCLGADAEGHVLTMTPALRSRSCNILDVIDMSWSSRDLDVFLPPGSVLRVFSSGRFRWSWSVRPGRPWFGHPLNPLPLGPEFRSLNAPSSSSSPAPQSGKQELTSTHDSNLNPTGATRWWWPFSGGGGDISSSSAAPCASLTNGGGAGGGRHRPFIDAAAHPPPRRPEAFLIFHYEGPVDDKKTRRPFWRWERFAYGKAPVKEEFNWDPDLPPTEEDVKQQGRLRWLLTNLQNFGQHAQ